MSPRPERCQYGRPRRPSVPCSVAAVCGVADGGVVRAHGAGRVRSAAVA